MEMALRAANSDANEAKATAVAAEVELADESRSIPNQVLLEVDFVLRLKKALPFPCRSARAASWCLRGGGESTPSQ